MRHIVLVFPDWVSSPDGEDVLRQPLEALSRLAEMGKISRLSVDPKVETAEALALGLDPDRVILRQGPLTVSALGADPPERSTHFHLSLLEFRNGSIWGSELEPSPEDVRKLLEAAVKLNTKVLTLVPGEERDHGLVWEGRGDLGTTAPDRAFAKPIKSVLPEGDAETILRRYIDDSTNLLSGLELNQIREEEGLPLFNVLWPWGHGVRTRVPNLALQRGAPTLVLSPSLRMQGLTRLAGYLSVDRRKLRSGINLNFEFLRKKVLSEPSTLVYSQVFSELKAKEMTEEAAWFTHRINEELLQPILDQMADEPILLSIVAPSTQNVGLALQVDSKGLGLNTLPFDARTTEEQRATVTTSWESVAANLG